MIKQCKTCNVDLVPKENWSEGQIKSRSRLCRSCNAAKGRAFYAKNKDHVIATAKARRQSDLERVRGYWISYRKANGPALRTHEADRRDRVLATIGGRARRIFSRSRCQARVAKVGHDLTLEWIETRLRAGRCEVTGLPFVFAPSRGDGSPRVHPFSPSLDRIKQGGDYSAANTRMVVFIYNVARSDFADDDLLTLARALAGDPSPT